MAEKSWSDYWKKYKTPSKDKVVHRPKPAESKPKVEKVKPISEVAKPKIRIERTRKTYPKINTPNLNKQSLLMILFLATIFALAFFQFRSGQHIRTLQVNVTNLTEALDSCAASNIELSTELGSCSSNLENCNSDLSDKTSLLNNCKNDKAAVSSSLSSCQENYNDCRSENRDLNLELDGVKDNYDSCQSELEDVEDDYDDLLQNLRGYAAKGKCCGTSSATSYSVDNNEIVCYADDSGEYSLSC